MNTNHSDLNNPLKINRLYSTIYLEAFHQITKLLKCLSPVPIHKDK